MYSKYLLKESRNKHISFPAMDTDRTFWLRITLVFTIGLFFAVFRIEANDFIERPKLRINAFAK